MKKLNLPVTALALGLATAPLAEAQGGPILDAAQEQYSGQPEKIVTIVVEQVSSTIRSGDRLEKVAAGYAELEVTAHSHLYDLLREGNFSLLISLCELQKKLRHQVVFGGLKSEKTEFDLATSQTLSGEMDHYSKKLEKDPENKQFRLNFEAAFMAYRASLYQHKK